MPVWLLKRDSVNKRFHWIDEEEGIADIFIIYSDLYYCCFLVLVDDIVVDIVVDTASWGVEGPSWKALDTEAYNQPWDKQLNNTCWLAHCWDSPSWEAYHQP